MQVNGQAPVASFTVNGSTSGCAPLTVQFTNTSVNATSWQWDFGNGNTSALANPAMTYLSAGSYTVKLVATGPGGKDSVSMPAYISIAAQPVALFNAPQTTACAGEPISFTNQSSGFSSCLWDFGDGTTSTASNPVHAYAQAGSYTITLVAYNSMGCAATETRQQYITINPVPSSGFTVNTQASCDPAHGFQFTPSGTGTTSWQWDFGDGQTSAQPGPLHTYAAPGTYTVTLVTGNAAGCSDTTIMPGYVSLLANPLPVITASTDTGCAPEILSFSGGVTGVSTYAWDFGTGGTSYLASPNHQFQSPGSYTVNLQVTYSNGCTNTAAPQPVTMFPSPAATYVPTGNSQCAPATISFVNTGPQSGVSYLWDFGDGNTSTQFQPTHVYTTAGDYLVILTATNAHGCSSVYKNINYTVHINDPDAEFVPDVFTGCPPLSVNFSPFNTSASNSYVWDFGDGTTSTSQFPNHVYTASGTYTVSLTVTDATGCSSTFTMNNAVQTSSTVSGFNTPDTIYACAPFTVNLSDSSAGAVSWAWDFGDGTTSGQQNPTHTYTQPGVYTVSLQTTASGTGCDQDIPNYGVFVISGGIADFTFTVTKCPPYVANFFDSSFNAVSWFWEFGDGKTSTLQNPTHTYANPGSYSVSLTITTADGCTVTTKHQYAVNFEPLIANPIATTCDTVQPYGVQFYANSQGATGWLWNFGDSTTSSQPNPIHQFGGPPPYNVTLTLFNDSCSITLTFPNITIGQGPVELGEDSTFVHEPEPEEGCAPMLVHFYNPVLNAVNWLWDFGDGSTSAAQNPSHTYNIPGVYDLTLITTDGWGNVDTLSKPQWVNISGVEASFGIQVNNGCQHNSVTLVNQSTGGVSYTWNFGDGNTSTQTNPQHTYVNASANYVISLTASDSAGCTDLAMRTFYGIPAEAIASSEKRICAGDTVQFFSSAINFASYQWNFGDSTSSTSKNPYHVYSGAGVYAVTLTATDTSGCQKVFTLPYQITVNKPEASYTVKYHNWSCTGSWVQFQNTSVNANMYHWDFGDGTTSANHSPLHYFTTPGNHQVSLTATYANCSATFTAPQPVVVPELEAGFSYLKNSNCLPSQIAFTDSSQDAVSWMWDFGDGQISTQQHPQHVYTTQPMASVTLIVTDVRGCTDTASKAVIVATDADFVIDTMSGCRPLTVQFSDSSLNPVSWHWDFGDGNTSQLQHPQHVYAQNGIYDVTLIVTGTDGCLDTMHVDSMVYVSRPAAAFTVNNPGGCAPTIVQFNDQSQLASGWHWDFGDGNYSSAPSPTHIYNIPGQYQVSLVVTDSIGCTDMMQWQSQVSVEGPIAKFTVPQTEGCAPVTLTFNNQSTGSAGYYWNFGDGDTSVAPAPVHQYASPGYYTVTLIATDSNGCESVFTLSDTLKIYPPADVSFSVSDTASCLPFQVAFTNTSTSAAQYHWDFGDGQTSTQVAPGHTYTTGGSFRVTLTGNNAMCTDTAIMDLSAYANPVAGFTSNVTAGCAPLAILFSNQSQHLQNPTYFWDFGNGFTSTQASPVNAYFQAGQYNVKLVVRNGDLCADSITKQAYITIYETDPPTISDLLSVTVASDSEVDITWKNVSDPDLYSYDLFRLDPATGTYNLVYSHADTTMFGQPTTTYRDKGLNTLDYTYTYKVQTVDLCYSKIDLNALQPHTTMNITAVAQGSQVSIGWTPYGGCPVDSYELYRMDNISGSYQLIATLDATQLSYKDTGTICPIPYNYRVRATDLCGNTYYSNSDTAAAIPTSDVINQYVDAVFATVVDDRDILVEWEAPVLLPDMVQSYKVYRSDDKNHYQLAGTVPYTSLSFLDTDVRVHDRPYYYLVIPFSTCETEGLKGLIGSSIWLQSKFDEISQAATLYWSPYEEWDEGVEKYIIQRKVGNTPWETIREVDGKTHQVIDQQ